MSFMERACGLPAGGAGEWVFESLDRYAAAAFEENLTAELGLAESGPATTLGGLAPGGDKVVEGVAGLIYREDDGCSLVIVDYETGVGVSATRLAQYWAQLAIYADLLRNIACQAVSSVVLVFCRSTDAVVLARSLR